MKTIKMSFALLLAGSISAFAQVQTMEKPLVLNKNISVTEKARAKQIKKVNPLYQTSIQRRQISVIDADAREEKSLKTASVNNPVYEIKAFPNPFTTQIDVIITDGAMHKSVYKANLYDVNGKLVYSETLTANQSSLQLAHFSAGMYLLHIEKNGTIVKQEKFIKE